MKELIAGSTNIFCFHFQLIVNIVPKINFELGVYKLVLHQGKTHSINEWDKF